MLKKDCANPQKTILNSKQDPNIFKNMKYARLNYVEMLKKTNKLYTRVLFAIFLNGVDSFF